MYNDHINQPSAATAPKPLSIRLNALPFNEDAAFVESVCAALIESRFGPGSSVTFNYRVAEQPESEPAVLDDMTYEYSPRFSMTQYDPTTFRNSTVDAVGLKSQHFEHACIAAHFQNLSPPNQARGSP